MSLNSSELRHTHILNQMYRAILARFPLLEVLEFSDDLRSTPTVLPQFVGLIATVLESADKPCCIVLPDCAGVAITVTTLLAITRLRNDFPEVLRLHASISFKEGIDHVLVHPCGLVYRYEGFFSPQFFRLKVVDRNESRALPVTEIARLEKTTRKRPKGYLNSDLSQSQVTLLASLLGTKTSVNRHFLQNRVLVLGARKSFVEELYRWTIQTRTAEQTIGGTLKDEFPFGKVTEGGELRFLDDYAAAGEPLVAVASRTEDLVEHCSKVQSFSKSVLVGDIDYLTRDLRAYDSIAESQHTVILASDSQWESVLLLEERGCEVWRLVPDEILFGLSAERRELPFRALVQKTSNAQNLVISELPCRDEHLDQAAAELTQAADSLRFSDDGTIVELLRSFFRVLMFCAEYLGRDSEHFANVAGGLLRLTRENLQTAKVWLTPETNGQLTHAIDELQAVVTTWAKSDVTSKGQVLLENLKTVDSTQIAALVVRRKADCEQLRQWIGQLGAHVEVYAVNEVPEDRTFDRVFLISWPRRERFDWLVHQYVTNRLQLLAYQFEQDWLDRYRQSYKRSALTRISTERKLKLLGLPESEFQNVQAESETGESMSSSVKFDLPAERFLTRRKIGNLPGSIQDVNEEVTDATYVDFAGPTFAYLTDGHELPVLNAYVSGEQANPSKIPMRSVEELRSGDYIMFRESGDSDIIRFLAEDEIGKKAYQELRLTASRWKNALKKLGRDPRQIWDNLRTFGFTRHLQTVRGWLADDGTICPQDIRDVRMIAGAAYDKELFALLPDVERARDDLMRLHIKAGFRLSELLLRELPTKISLLEHGETELDLGVGKVWVVHIEEIDRSPSPQRRSQVNRLLWDIGAT